jgi:hypothetical protein
MLSYQGLGKAEEAKHEETLYRRFKADESAQAITGPYRKLHPEDNNERQQIHEHVSVPLDRLNKKSELRQPYVAAHKRRREMSAQIK